MFGVVVACVCRDTTRRLVLETRLLFFRELWLATRSFMIPRLHDPVKSSNGMDFRHGLWMVPTTWTTRKTMELTILLLKVIVSPFLLALSNVFYVSLPLKFKRGRSLRQAGNSSFISIPRNTEIWPCINLWQFIAQQKVAIKFRK